MFAIIAVSAATLNSHGLTNIVTAEDAAKALRPIAGDYAYLLFEVSITPSFSPMLSDDPAKSWRPHFLSE